MTNFSGILINQWPSHCGAASLASALSVLGLKATQRGVARATGRSLLHIVNEGLEAHELARAAVPHGAKVRPLLVQDSSSGAQFADRLARHLDTSGPALLLVQDQAHWIAVVGHHADDDRFVIMDPNEDDQDFELWPRAKLLRQAWNAADDTDPSCFCAGLVSRADGAPPLWRMTKDFTRLCARGSAETAVVLVEELRIMVERAGGQAKARVPLADVLRRLEQPVVGELWEWTQTDGLELTKAGLTRLYRDFIVVAEAASITAPRDASDITLAVQLTAWLAAALWNDEEV